MMMDLDCAARNLADAASALIDMLVEDDEMDGLTGVAVGRMQYALEIFRARMGYDDAIAAKPFAESDIETFCSKP